MPKAVTESWFWSFFLRHPKYASKDPGAFTTDKAKAYCKKCFDADVVNVQRTDQDEVTNMRRDAVRTREDIETFRAL